jgi:hypothetical protein
MASNMESNTLRQLDNFFTLKNSFQGLEMKLLETQKQLLDCQSQMLDLKRTNRLLEQDLENKFNKTIVRLDTLETKVGMSTSDEETQSDPWDEESEEEYAELGYDNEEDEDDDDDDDDEAGWGDRRRI